MSRNLIRYSDRILHATTSLDRRTTLKLAVGSAASLAFNPVAGADAEADTRTPPTPGDRLALEDADGAALALKPDDVSLNAKPLGAFPFDKTQGIRRDGSRLNRVALVRLDPATVSPEMAEGSADGLFAFSGVCTHRGCDVTEWNGKDQTLLCYCHLSQFDPRHHGQVFAGPAPRPLPVLPIRIEAGEIIVAGVFSAAPGGAKTKE